MGYAILRLGRRHFDAAAHYRLPPISAPAGMPITSRAAWIAGRVFYGEARKARLIGLRHRLFRSCIDCR